MEELISKSVEYRDSIQDTEYIIKALIVSTPDDLEIKNIDREENKGFIFTISVLTQPSLPTEIFDTVKNLIYIVGKGGVNRIGFLEGDTFVEIKENAFTRRVEVDVLEVLMMEGNSGHFKS